MTHIAVLCLKRSWGKPKNLFTISFHTIKSYVLQHLHIAKYKRQTVVPTRYSVVRPLLRPLRADLTICGVQKKEYIVPTNNNVIDGETMTRTMNDKNMNIVNPVKRIRLSMILKTTNDSRTDIVSSEDPSVYYV